MIGYIIIGIWVGLIFIGVISEFVSKWVDKRRKKKAVEEIFGNYDIEKEITDYKMKLNSIGFARVVNEEPERYYVGRRGLRRMSRARIEFEQKYKPFLGKCPKCGKGDKTYSYHLRNNFVVECNNYGCDYKIEKIIADNWLKGLKEEEKGVEKTQFINELKEALTL